MSTRKTTVFYAVLIAIASLAVGMVIASRLDLTPASSAQMVAMPAMNSTPLGGPIDATTFRNIAKAQIPTVVNIRTESRQRTQDLTEFFGGGQGGDDFLRRFFGGQAPDSPRQQRPRQRQPQGQLTEGAGTGFVIDKAGYILTNNHVIDGADKITVAFVGAARNEEYPAKVVGRDALTDSALLQLTEMPSAPLQEAKFGDSSQMQQGDWVMNLLSFLPFLLFQSPDAEGWYNRGLLLLPLCVSGSARTCTTIGRSVAIISLKLPRTGLKPSSFSQPAVISTTTTRQQSAGSRSGWAKRGWR